MAKEIKVFVKELQAWLLITRILLDKTYLSADLFMDEEMTEHILYSDWNWSKYKNCRVQFKLEKGHLWLKTHNRNLRIANILEAVYEKEIAKLTSPEPKDPDPKPEKKVEVKEDRKPVNLLSKVKAAMEARKAAAAADSVKEEVVSKEADHDEEDQGVVRIFTDGACSPNPGMGGWGVVMYDARGGKHEYSGAEENSTNNRMELQGPIEALKKCSGKYPIVLTSDSNYLVKGMTEWIQGWIQKGWKNSQRQPVPNRDLWEELLALTQGKRIEWRWVKGHGVNEDNNRCDQLAVFAREQLAAELAHHQDVEVYEDGCDSDLLGLDEGI